MKFLPFIWNNMRRNTRRTLLTVLSMAISLFLFCTLISVMALMDRMIKRGGALPVLAVHRRTAITDMLPDAYRAKIERIDGVEVVCPFEWYGGVGKDEKYFFQSLGCDPNTMDQLFPEFMPTTEEYASFRQERTGALVGARTAEKLEIKKGDHIQLRGTLYPVNLEFTVSAILPVTADPSIFLFHRDYLEEAIGKPGNVNIYWVKVKSPDLMAPVAKTIDAMFANSPAETWSESRSAMFSRFLAQQGNVKAIANLIAGLVLVTLLLVVANSMAMSMRERTVEIAVLKALGFLRGRILALLLTETVLIATIGGGLGCLIGYILFNTKGISVGFGPLSNVRVDGGVLAQGTAVSCVVGLLSGIFPAWRATQIPVVDALRKTG